MKKVKQFLAMILAATLAVGPVQGGVYAAQTGRAEKTILAAVRQDDSTGAGTSSIEAADSIEEGSFAEDGTSAEADPLPEIMEDEAGDSPSMPEEGRQNPNLPPEGSGENQDGSLTEENSEQAASDKAEWSVPAEDDGDAKAPANAAGEPDIQTVPTQEQGGNNRDVLQEEGTGQGTGDQDVMSQDADAKEEESPVIESESEEELLTLYPAMAGDVDGDNAPVYNSVTSLLGYVRQQAVKRVQTITVRVPSSVFTKLNLNNYQDVTAHTGTPDEGDYLRCAMKTMGAIYSTSGDGYYSLQYNFTYHDTAANEQAAGTETARLVDALGLKDSGKSDYDKVRAIHDFITANVQYDYDTLNGIRDDYPQTYCGYGAIVNHLAVCQGFSSMFYRLCLEAGIDARIINSRSLVHAWNIVKLGSTYYQMDCTWDQNTGTDSYFLCGKYDFNGHNNSDDQFQDAAFSQSYPLSSYKYGFAIKSLGTAPDYTLITSDRRTVSTAAQNGRAKVLVYLKEGCSNCEYTLECLRGKEFDGVDFVFIYMLWDSSDQQNALSLIGSEFPTDVPGVYAVCANGSESLSDFETVAGIKDPNGWIYSATVFLINPDNQILYAEHGYCGDLAPMVENMLASSALPAAPAAGADPYAGFTAIGNCGKNAVWRFYKDGTLRINGSGKLYDNGSYYTSIGWLPNEADIQFSFSCENISAPAVKKVILDKGITYVGCAMFSDCTNLTSITFLGSAPEFHGYQGMDHDLSIYYPDGDASWKNVDRSLFTSGSKWISQNADGTHTHKWSAWKTKKAATTKEEGIKERSCTECGQKQTQAIAKLDPLEQKISVKASASKVSVGKTITVSVTGAKGKITFSSSNTALATVDKNGKVKAVKTGTVKITAKAAATDSYKAASKTVTIYVVPAATSSITGQNLKKGIKLTWKKVAGATGYKFYRGSKLLKEISGSSVTTYTDTAVGKNGAKYTYKVVAFASTGDSTLSKSLTTCFVSQPAVKKLSNAKGLKATVEWTQNTAATGYEVQYGLKNTFSGAKTVTVNKKSTVKATLSKLLKGKTYYVRIRTYKTVGKTKYCSAWSVAKTVKITK